MTTQDLSIILNKLTFPHVLDNSLDRLLYGLIEKEYGEENSVVTYNPNDGNCQDMKKRTTIGLIQLKPGYILALNSLLSRYGIRSARLNEIQKFLKENPEFLGEYNATSYENSRKGIYIPNSFEAGIFVDFSCGEKGIMYQDFVQKDFLEQLKQKLGLKAYAPFLVHYDQLELVENPELARQGLFAGERIGKGYRFKIKSDAILIPAPELISDYAHGIFFETDESGFPKIEHKYDGLTQNEKSDLAYALNANQFFTLGSYMSNLRQFKRSLQAHPFDPYQGGLSNLLLVKSS